MATYIAICLGYWGKGRTPEAAKKKAKEAGASLRITSKQWLVKQLPSGAIKAHVDSMGSICWTWAEGADHCAVSTVVEAPQKGR